MGIKEIISCHSSRTACRREVALSNEQNENGLGIPATDEPHRTHGNPCHPASPGGCRNRPFFCLCFQQEDRPRFGERRRNGPYRTEFQPSRCSQSQQETKVVNCFNHHDGGNRTQKIADYFRNESSTGQSGFDELDHHLYSLFFAVNYHAGSQTIEAVKGRHRCCRRFRLFRFHLNGFNSLTSSTRRPLPV